MFANEPLAACTLAIIAVTIICSLIGFRDPIFQDKHLFSVREILTGRQYQRLFTSALLHADWNHLLLNMVGLYLFGSGLEFSLGVWKFLTIYLVAILGGSALSLWIHRQHEYTAYGASGGVCGVIFSHTLLFPDARLTMFLLPFPMPAWLYAVFYFIASTVALRRRADNIGHDAHLGGAILGFWTTAILHPGAVQQHLNLFLAISGLAILLFVYLVKNPLFLPLVNFFPAWLRRRSSSGQRPNNLAAAGQMDAILDKISRNGIHSLSRDEKAWLDSTSRKLQRPPDANEER